jgi:cleavage and polyadenylation specificity factor subunit 1
MDGVKLTLDCAQAEFVTPDRAVISLKGGELYVLSLIADAMRTVRGFHFDRAAASVLTTCLSVCDESYLFLGSRLGNSLLLQFTQKEVGKSAHQFNYLNFSDFLSTILGIFVINIFDIFDF